MILDQRVERGDAIRQHLGLTYVSEKNHSNTELYPPLPP